MQAVLIKKKIQKKIQLKINNMLTIKNNIYF